MRVPRFILVGAMLSCPASALQAQSQLRIAYLDSQVILQGAPGAKEAQDEFDRQMQNSTRELTTLAAELDTLAARYQQQQGSLLPNVRQAREAEIQQKDQRYQARTTELQAQADTIRQRLMQPILEQITAMIETMRAEGGYSLILDAAAQSIVAADPELDITEDVIIRLNRTAAPAPPAGTP
ncbi:MAG: OmpH family outer membrane protein [Gemmatimonadetes bacterium]|nr:OmpH family outer membrane protein [Gemmatimonadota bacterium]